MIIIHCQSSASRTVKYTSSTDKPIVNVILNYEITQENIIATYSRKFHGRAVSTIGRDDLSPEINNDFNRRLLLSGKTFCIYSGPEGGSGTQQLCYVYVPAGLRNSAVSGSSLSASVSPYTRNSQFLPQSQPYCHIATIKSYYCNILYYR